MRITSLRLLRHSIGHLAPLRRRRPAARGPTRHIAVSCRDNAGES